MTRNRILFVAGILIIIGGMLMRFAWVISERQMNDVVMIMGAILFLGGIIVLAITLFRRPN